MKLLRTIRFDPSDVHVFDNAAPEGDWAISGTFAFANTAEGSLTGKHRQAFVSGWMGLPSLGHSTFVTVARATEDDRQRMINTLAQHFVDAYSAPNVQAARPVAEAEVDHARDLAAEADVGAVFALTRDHDDQGQVREAIRSIRRPGNCGQSRVWDMVEES